VLLTGHGGGTPSAWVQRFAGLIRPGGSVLDVACGSGRHALWLAQQGHAVTGVDRDGAALLGLQGRITTLQADIENAAWPLPGQVFDAVVVTNYLWRPLLPTLLASLAAGGVLIYETFADGQQLIGKPSRPDFLLQAGELLRVCAGLRVLAFEDGFEEGFEGAAARYVQRIVAVAAPAQASATPRYVLGRSSGPGR
jgi:SAM-dependent methyltransferase